MGFRGKFLVFLVLVLALALITPAFAAEQQKLSDAWWTGPLQTPGANTIPKNHWYVETYFVVEQDNGTFADTGTKYGANTAKAHLLGMPGYDNNYQSNTLFVYGITNKFNLQMLLSMDGTQGGTGVTGSNGMEVGGFRIRLPYKLVAYKQGKWYPTLTFVPEVRTPVAAGAVWTPGIGIWAIRPFWMPNGRILRIRASEDIWFPKGGKGVALANCAAGAATCSLDKANFGVTQIGFEYSLTKRWVPAWDFVFYYAGQNKYNGTAATGIVNFSPTTGLPITGALQGARQFNIDPALEYNFTENTGVIFGAEITLTGRNVGSYIAPQIALQWFK
jgi:hypothetical protein